MRQISKLASASAIFIMTTATVFAAPCATGSAGGKGDTAAMKDKSSNVEPGSTGNVTPGAKAESPGTVGAMNNVGANRATSASDVAKQQDGKQTAAQEGSGC